MRTSCARLKTENAGRAPQKTKKISKVGAGVFFFRVPSLACAEKHGDE